MVSAHGCEIDAHQARAKEQKQQKKDLEEEARKKRATSRLSLLDTATFKANSELNSAINTVRGNLRDTALAEGNRYFCLLSL